MEEFEEKADKLEAQLKEAEEKLEQANGEIEIYNKKN